MRKAKGVIGFLIGLIGVYMVSLTLFATPPTIISTELWNDVLWISAGILLVAFGVSLVTT